MLGQRAGRQQMYASVEPDYLDSLRAMADADLLRRAKLGNDVALSVLLARHSEALLRFCRHLSTTPEDAEDIFQETMVRAIARVNSVHTGSSFRSWLFRIAKNLSVDSFRRRKRTCPLPDEEITPLPVHEDGPHDSVETGEEHQTVAQALQRLAASHQRVLVLREVEGLSYAAIAQELNVSQSAVETLLFRARRRLREEYIKRVAAVPAVAAMAALRDLVARTAGPLIGGPPLVKVAVTAAVVTVAMTTPRLLPRHPLPMMHVPARNARVAVRQVHARASARHAKVHAAYAKRVHLRRQRRKRKVMAARRVYKRAYLRAKSRLHRAHLRLHRAHIRRHHRAHRAREKLTPRMKSDRRLSPPAPPRETNDPPHAARPTTSRARSTTPASGSPPPPPPPGVPANQVAATVPRAPAVPEQMRVAGRHSVKPARTRARRAVRKRRPHRTTVARRKQQGRPTQSASPVPVRSIPPPPAIPAAPPAQPSGSVTTAQPTAVTGSQTAWSSPPPSPSGP